MTWWNPGSEYVRDDAFDAFISIMKRVRPEYEFYGENRLTRDELYALLAELRLLGGRTQAASNATELKAAFDGHADVNDTDFARKKAALALMVEDFAVLAKLAIKHRQPLWILAP